MYEEERNKMLKEFFAAKSKMVYCHAIRRRLIAEFGGCCIICKSKDKMQFAHMDDTRVGGTGRGRILRYIDVILFREKYKLMCMRCHAIFDTLLHCGGMKRRNAFKLLKEIVASNKNISITGITRFDGEKFVLREEFIKK
jgi:hypothetical protein